MCLQRLRNQTKPSPFRIFKGTAYYTTKRQPPLNLFVQIVEASIQLDMRQLEYHELVLRTQ